MTGNIETVLCRIGFVAPPLLLCCRHLPFEIGYFVLIVRNLVRDAPVCWVDTGTVVMPVAAADRMATLGRHELVLDPVDELGDQCVLAHQQVPLTSVDPVQ